MSENIRIWLAVSYAAAFRTGGWAFVRSDGGEVVGMAGGDRRIGGERIALLALLAALKDLPPGAAVRMVTSDRFVAAVPRALAPPLGEDPPQEDLDLWAQLDTALKARQVRIVREAAEPRTPLAFAAAWAEQAREKAKAGAFAWAIPKPNLAKAGV